MSIWPWDWSNPYKNNDNNQGKLPPVVHPPVVTRRGRVVYDRGLHVFSEADLRRIAGNVLEVNKKKDGKWDYLDFMDKTAAWMLSKILERVMSEYAAEVASQRIYYMAQNFLARILDKLLEEDRVKFIENLDPLGSK